MAYSLKKILSIVLNAKRREIGDTIKTKQAFLFYDKEEKMCCYYDWCYEVTEHKMKLSELQPEYKPNISTPFYVYLRNEIEKNGLDITKGVITIKDKNNIADGHHRYFILKELYGVDYEITVFRPVKKYNFIRHYIFLFTIIPLIKVSYKIITFFSPQIKKFLG